MRGESVCLEMSLGHYRVPVVLSCKSCMQHTPVTEVALESIVSLVSSAESP